MLKYLKSFLQKDKLYHFLINFFGVNIIANIPTFELFHAISTMFFISFVKELYDRIKPKPTGFSTKDLIADIVGIIFGAYAYYLIFM